MIFKFIVFSSMQAFEHVVFLMIHFLWELVTYHRHKAIAFIMILLLLLLLITLTCWDICTLDEFIVHRRGWTLSKVIYSVLSVTCTVTRYLRFLRIEVGVQVFGILSICMLIVMMVCQSGGTTICGIRILSSLRGSCTTTYAWAVISECTCACCPIIRSTRRHRALQMYRFYLHLFFGLLVHIFLFLDFLFYRIRKSS
jgi:hypothetical protein